MNPFDDDTEMSSASSSGEDLSTVIIEDPLVPPTHAHNNDGNDYNYHQQEDEESEFSDESEIRRLQQQYNEEEEVQQDDVVNDEKNDEYEQSGINESEALDVYSPTTFTTNQSQKSLTGFSSKPLLSNYSTEQSDIMNQKQQHQQKLATIPQSPPSAQYSPYSFVTTTTTVTSVPKSNINNNKLMTPNQDIPKTPITPISPLSPAVNNNNKVITKVADPIKWVNFIARVKSHQTKKIWQTYNYNSKGYEENANKILANLKSIDKNSEHGSLIIDDNKVFVFIRNYTKFPFQMLLRTNNDNENDAMKILQQINDHTVSSIQQLNIYDIATFDYNLHFDNIINKLRIAPKYHPTFYAK